MVSIDHYSHELLQQLKRGLDGGAIDLLINSGELCRSLEPSLGHLKGMPNCCDAMQAEMQLGDTMILGRSSGVGMTVRYLLPRNVPT